MKNKITLCVIMALSSAPQVSHAIYWGTKFTGSSWTMDGKDSIKSMHTIEAAAQGLGLSMTGKVTQGKLGGTAGLFMEGKSRFCLGAAVGYGLMPSVATKFMLTNGGAYVNAAFENKITYIPLDLYLKYTSNGGKHSLFGGGGIDYVIASTDFIRNDSAGDRIHGTFTQKKVIPHVQADYELFLAKWISLNMGVKYLFNAILDNLTGNVTINDEAQGKSILIMRPSGGYGEAFWYRKISEPPASGDRPLKYDLSGLRANIGFRVYFN